MLFIFIRVHCCIEGYFHQLAKVSIKAAEFDLAMGEESKLETNVKSCTAGNNNDRNRQC
jgi:hypothetical protein